MWTGVSSPALCGGKSFVFFAINIVWCKLALLPVGARVDGRNLVDSLNRMFGQVREVALLRSEA